MQKRITRNRATRDYDMFADGQYIGSAPSYDAAERELDAHAYNVASDLRAVLADENAERNEVAA